MKLVYRCILISATLCLSFSSISQLRSARQLIDRAYLYDYPEGYVILKDGTKIEGTFSKVNSSNLRITDGYPTTYNLNHQSILEIGSSMKVPKRNAALRWYSWKKKEVAQSVYGLVGGTDEKSTSSEFQDGYILLRNGEKIEGLISIEGRYTYGSFALSSASLYIDKKNSKKYSFEEIEAYGRHIPLNTSPYYTWEMKLGLVGGKKSKTKPTPGWIELKDGTMKSGELMVIYERIVGPKKPPEGNVQPPKDFKISWYPLEFEIDGEEEPFPASDVAAYGLDLIMTDITLPDESNYQASGIFVKRKPGNTEGIVDKFIEKMNFHPGFVIDSDGTKHEGKVAYWPGPDVYRGVYLEPATGEKLMVFYDDKIKESEQNIATLDIEDYESFDDLTSKKVIVKVNGHIVDLAGNEIKGNITLNEYGGWWARSIDFMTTEGDAMVFGGNNERIKYFVLNTDSTDTWFVQRKSVFVKASKTGKSLIYLDNPFPETLSGAGRFVSGLVGSAAGALANSDLDVELDKDPHQGAREMFEDMPTNEFFQVTEEKIIYIPKSNESIVMAKKGLYGVNILLNGCHDYHSLDKKTKKSMVSMEKFEEVFQYLDDCYTKQ